jgi:integrase
MYPLSVQGITEGGVQMPSLTITTRQTEKSGTRYVVRYRLGGRAWPIVHGGSFHMMKEARARRDFVAGEIAAGRDPAESLRALVERTPERTIKEWGEVMVASRRDISESRAAFLELSQRTRINPIFGHREPQTISVAEAVEWIGSMVDDGLAARSVEKYRQAFAQQLKYAGIKDDENPLRHDNVKQAVPYADVEEVNPPSTEHFLAIVARLSKRFRLPAIFLEQPAARASELRSWEWQDVDEDGLRIRSRGVKGRRGTRRVLWRQVPDWLMQALLDTVPPDDRTPGRRLFSDLREGAMRDAIGRACRSAKIPLYSPHDLRHRRGSLWHASGMPARQLAELLGHSKPSMSLDVYTHVMPPEEVESERVMALLRA